MSDLWRCGLTTSTYWRTVLHSENTSLEIQGVYIETRRFGSSSLASPTGAKADLHQPQGARVRENKELWPQADGIEFLVPDEYMFKNLS